MLNYQRVVGFQADSRDLKLDSREISPPRGLLPGESFEVTSPGLKFLSTRMVRGSTFQNYTETRWGELRGGAACDGPQGLQDTSIVGGVPSGNLLHSYWKWP